MRNLKQLQQIFQTITLIDQYHNYYINYSDNYQDTIFNILNGLQKYQNEDLLALLGNRLMYDQHLDSQEIAIDEYIYERGAYLIQNMNQSTDEQSFMQSILETLNDELSNKNNEFFEQQDLPLNYLRDQEQKFDIEPQPMEGYYEIIRFLYLSDILGFLDSKEKAQLSVVFYHSLHFNNIQIHDQDLIIQLQSLKSEIELAAKSLS